MLLVVLVLGATPMPVAAHWVAGSVLATTEFAAAPDWLAPLVQTTVIAKTTGYLPGSIRQGGTYYVYAMVSDDGDPPSGVAAESADVSLITPDGSATELLPGSYSVGGVTYTHRSSALTAQAVLAEGTHPYSIRSTDLAGNSGTQTDYSVTVDNTAPTASNIQTTNSPSGVNGRAERSDTVTFTFSERIDPESIIAGWNGATTNVVVRLIDGGCTTVGLSTVCSDDSIVVYDVANTGQLPLGSVDLGRGDYHGTSVGTEPPLTFGATGTPSTMAQSDAVVTVTLGTSSGTADTAAAAGDMVWSPSAAAYDAAGNPAQSTPVTELAPLDKEF